MPASLSDTDSRSPVLNIDVSDIDDEGAAPFSPATELKYFLTQGVPLGVAAVLEWGLPPLVTIMFAGHTNDSAALQATLGYARVYYNIVGIMPVCALAQYFGNVLPGCIGARREDRIPAYFRRALVMSFLCLIPSFLLLLVAGPVMRAVRVPPSIADDAGIYCYWATLGLAMLAVEIPLEQILINKGRAKVAGANSILAGLGVDVLLAYIFLIRWHLGIHGASFVMLAVRAVRLVFYLVAVPVCGLLPLLRGGMRCQIRDNIATSAVAMGAGAFHTRDAGHQTRSLSADLSASDTTCSEADSASASSHDRTLETAPLCGTPRRGRSARGAGMPDGPRAKRRRHATWAASGAALRLPLQADSASLAPAHFRPSKDSEAHCAPGGAHPAAAIVSAGQSADADERNPIPSSAAGAAAATRSVHPDLPEGPDLESERPREGAALQTAAAPASHDARGSDAIFSRVEMLVFASQVGPTYVSFLASWAIFELQIIALANVPHVTAAARAAGALWIQAEGTLAAVQTGWIAVVSMRVLKLLGRGDASGALRSFAMMIALAVVVVAVLATAPLLAVPRQVAHISSNDPLVQEWFRKVVWLLATHTQIRVVYVSLANMFVPIGHPVAGVLFTFVAHYLIASPVCGMLALGHLVSTSLFVRVLLCLGASTAAMALAAPVMGGYIFALDWRRLADVVHKRAHTDQVVVPPTSRADEVAAPPATVAHTNEAASPT
eukprot:TRINITY_DN9723_c0_g2_i1.p1 TRINITY_DN9723_c0_g2~~TRINITY_DN9723_c0_g2_i1.p1  ORF type:complete len:723 (-),score=85.16 TRINITY_DN9723_c0_g2_i1:388-2556(-)